MKTPTGAVSPIGGTLFIAFHSTSHNAPSSTSINISLLIDCYLSRESKQVIREESFRSVTFLDQTVDSTHEYLLSKNCRFCVRPQVFSETTTVSTHMRTPTLARNGLEIGGTGAERCSRRTAIITFGVLNLIVY
jgi:hypothetical protein